MRTLLAALILAGCRQAAPSPEAVPEATASIFEYARPYVGRERPPERFGAPLPTSVADLLDTGGFPPESVVRAALDRGDRDMRSRLRDALRTSVRRGELRGGLERYYDRVFGARPSDASCEFLHQRVLSEPRGVTPVCWSALARCTDARYADAFAAAPARALVARYRLAEDELDFTPRLGAAALALARLGRVEARQAGEALARVRGPRAVREVRRLQRRLRDRELRALVGLGLARRSERAARPVVRRACEHPSVRHEPACAHGVRSYDLNSDVRSAAVEVIWLLSAHQRDDVVDALARCVLHSEWDDDRTRCLRRLAGLDWRRAVAAATSAAETVMTTSPMRPAVDALVRFPEPGALAAHLRSHGLLESDDTGDGAAGLSAADLLVAHGRALRFDAQTRDLPARHDRLLERLARLVRPALDGVAFQEVAPDAGGPYRLRAWDGDRLFELRVRDLEGWYHVPALVGLLNFLVRARASDRRFLTLRGDLDAMTVVAGPAAGIEDAVEAELITPRGAGPASTAFRLRSTP